MAHTIARAIGHDKNREKEVHRLGSFRAEAIAATWHTKARVVVDADGTVLVEVTQDGIRLHSWECTVPEASRDVRAIAEANRR